MRTHRARVVPARQISLAPFFARSIASFSRKRPPIFRKLLPRCFFVIVLMFTSFYRRHISLFVFVLQTFLSAAVSFYYFSLLGPPEAANPFLQTVTPSLLFPKVKKAPAITASALQSANISGQFFYCFSRISISYPKSLSNLLCNPIYIRASPV